MTRKLERIFRQGRLSAEQVAHDEEVRRKVQAEFPSAVQQGSTSGPFSQVLRDALRTSDRSIDQIARDAGVSQKVISHFLSGEGDIHMATADKLAEALGLKLTSAT